MISKSKVISFLYLLPVLWIFWSAVEYIYPPFFFPNFLKGFAFPSEGSDYAFPLGFLYLGYSVFIIFKLYRELKFSFYFVVSIILILFSFLILFTATPIKDNLSSKYSQTATTDCEFEGSVVNLEKESISSETLVDVYPKQDYVLVTYELNLATIPSCAKEYRVEVSGGTEEGGTAAIDEIYLIYKNSTWEMGETSRFLDRGHQWSTSTLKGSFLYPQDLESQSPLQSLNLKMYVMDEDSKYYGLFIVDTVVE